MCVCNAVKTDCGHSRVCVHARLCLVGYPARNVVQLGLRSQFVFVAVATTAAVCSCHQLLSPHAPAFPGAVLCWWCVVMSAVSLFCPQAAQYRLELQQLKAEHAALQMLTQHAEQETVRGLLACLQDALTAGRKSL